MMAALRETSCTPLPEIHFEEFTRLASVDRHPSNLQVERKMSRRMSRRYKEWKSIVFACEQHMLQSARVLATWRFGPTITGMINLSLSLSYGSHLETFRTCLQQTLRARCEIIDVPPSREAQQRTRLILKWFVGEKRNVEIIKKTILETLCTGD